MNVEALPYTLLLILVELAVGSLWATLVSDLRGGVTRGFVMTMAFSVAVTAALGYWTASGLNIGADVDGYPIDGGWFDGVQRTLLIVAIIALVYAFAVFMGWDPVGRLAGIAGAAAGTLCIVFLAAMLEPPTWGYPAVFAGLLAGTLAMGVVSTAMVWGHWYLTEGALPAWPLRDLAWWFIGALALQTVVLVVNLAVPVSQEPTPANPVDVALALNPVLYFRIGIGLVFSMVLAVLSLRTAQMKSMQSATGLLYIAMATVFTGEVLAKGLMFLTARPL